MPSGSSRIPTSVYFSQEFHDLEVEKLWSRVWQLACHEDELCDVGDYVVYDVARLSFLLVRTGEGPETPTLPSSRALPPSELFSLGGRFVT